MYRQTLALVLVVSLSGSIARAQVQTDPSFEVASVKKVTTPGMIYGIRPVEPSGRFYAIITVRA